VKDITIDDYQNEEDIFSGKKISPEEKERRKVLEGLDSLAFLGKIEEEDDDSIYGLDDRFIIHLRKKIQEVREKKGRGLLISYFQHNEEQRIPRLIKCLEYNFKIALVSDAGTPTISDPGYKLIDEAHKHNIKVTALPGPTSVITALSKSGFPSDRYTFEGFLSKSDSLKFEKLEKIKAMETTAVLFENSERLMRTLVSIEKIFGQSQIIAIAFELTKFHELYYRGTVKELYEKLSEEEKGRALKGEVTLMIAPYLPDYNQELRQKVGGEEQDLTTRFSVNIDDLTIYLKKKLEASDKDIANMVCDILKVHKNKAMTHISRIREEERRSKKF
jgi:16S rRNA (cytidine(1402)-2'-O)-methyltransferase